MSNGNGTVLTKKDFRKCGWRWLLGSSTFNYGTQMATTVVFSEMKALRKIYPNDEDYKKSLKNAFKYFNATPPIAPLVLGATLAMEEKEGVEALDAVTELKVSLMGPISGIGDTIYWTLIPTVFGSIAAYMGMKGNPIGLLIYILANIFLFVTKFWFWDYGYRMGTKMISTLSGKLASFTEAASVLGLTVVGALIPTVISFTTSLTFTFNEISMSLQEDILDAIFPCLLPAVLTFVIYKLIKKKVGLTKIILGIIVFSLVAAALGIVG